MQSGIAFGRAEAQPGGRADADLRYLFGPRAAGAAHLVR